MNRAISTTALAAARAQLRRAQARAMSSASPNGSAHSSAPRNKSRAQGPITWPMLAVCGLVGTGGLMYYSSERERQIKAVTRPRTVGKAAIGGPFELHDANGAPFTHKQLLGKWSVIYFGFTMCPDICPAEMSKVAEALRMLEKKGIRVGHTEQSEVAPLFVTVDPERDDASRADEYAKMFHSAFVGVAGSAEQIRHMAKQYRVYYSRDQASDDDDDGDYLVDHSIITYLMDPQGEFAEFYGKNSSAAEMAARMHAQMLACKR